MPNGTVLAICVAPSAGAPMQEVKEVMAIAGVGLEGDRYAMGKGSYNKKTGIGRRQVSLINQRFFASSNFLFPECRRNFLVEGVELNWLSEGREFPVGDEVVFRGVKYCDPCQRPNNLSGNPHSFMEEFSDCAGILVEVITGGLIRVGDSVIPPPRGY